MSDRKIRVTVSVDTDELREWADWHASRGHHGVAHVLYKAADDGEGLGEQALREARKEGAQAALHEAADVVGKDYTTAAWLRDRAEGLR